ncbi:hypothetical protein Arad_8019 [Rhizobium rhizogenes K84]|uniref:Uncharacterized protein n=1 Tax=Rhizobium rhizogenes (strain K84 / ATCC BAA-868) TaxID=311403 RepID=B9JHJ9_RHIR8|nr:hypothetical protein Arad_8019 [Rhizobium rhizogenes K84]
MALRCKFLEGERSGTFTPSDLVGSGKVGTVHDLIIYRLSCLQLINRAEAG